MMYLRKDCWCCDWYSGIPCRGWVHAICLKYLDPHPPRSWTFPCQWHLVAITGGHRRMYGWQGYVFTGVCLSTGGSNWAGTPRKGHPLRQVPPGKEYREGKKSSCYIALCAKSGGNFTTVTNRQLFGFGNLWFYTFIKDPCLKKCYSI